MLHYYLIASHFLCTIGEDGWVKKKKNMIALGFHQMVRVIFWRTQYSSKPSPLQDLGTSWTPMLVEVIQNVCWALSKVFFPYIFISWKLVTLQYYSGFCHTLSKVLSRHCICSEHWDLPHWQQTFQLLTSYGAKERQHFLDSVGEGEGGMFWENSIETCILSMVKQITSPGWMHEISAQAWCTGRPRGIG